MSREVLENYLSRSISMEGLLNGRGDLDDNIRMLKSIGAKFIGRSLCLWGGEANLLRNLERAKQQVPMVHAADPEMILQACIFEIVTSQVEQIPVPDWAFVALGRPVEKRNFRYADMLYPDGQRRDQWGRNASVPDVSRPETKLWFYFLAASYIDLGIEAIHFGQAEIMNGNDPDLEHWSQVLAWSAPTRRSTPAGTWCSATPTCRAAAWCATGGSCWISIRSRCGSRRSPTSPQEAILKVGFSDGIYGRSRGGLTFSGWKCEHLPYLVEIDNWGASRQPGQSGAGGIWVWGYDEITWFAHQSERVPQRLAALRLGLGAEDGPQRLSPDARQPHPAIAAGPQAVVLRQRAQPSGPRRVRPGGDDPRHLGGRREECRWTPGRARSAATPSDNSSTKGGRG